MQRCTWQRWAWKAILKVLMPVVPLEFSFFKFNGFLEIQLRANWNAKTQSSCSNFIHQIITRTACLLQKGIKDHGHLFLMLARPVPNHHALPRSKSILRTWGWRAKILQSYCTTSQKRWAPCDCLAVLGYESHHSIIPSLPTVSGCTFSGIDPVLHCMFDHHLL